MRSRSRDTAIEFDHVNGAPRRSLPDGRILHLYAQLFNWKLTVSSEQSLSLHFWDECWCFADEKKARDAFEAWDGKGEPEGWIRHPTTGRRRVDGDPATEHVSP